MKIKQTLSLLALIIALLSCQDAQEELSKTDQLSDLPSSILASCINTNDIVDFPSSLTCGSPGSGSNGYEQILDFAYSSGTPGHIVTGIGIRSTNNEGKLIELRGYHIDENGDLCNFQQRTTNSSLSPERTVDVPANHAIVGVGALVANGDVKQLIAWYRKIEDDGTLNTNNIYWVQDAANSSYEYPTKTPECSILIGSNISTTVVTGLSFRVADNDVKGMKLHTATLNP